MSLLDWSNEVEQWLPGAEHDRLDYDIPCNDTGDFAYQANDSDDNALIYQQINTALVGRC